MKLHHVRAKHNERARQAVERSGYKSAGRVESKDHQSDIASDKSMIAEAVHKHERHDHPGTALTKLRKGGHVGGMHTLRRLDKAARGGAIKHKKGHTTVNVVVGQGGKQPVPVPVPVPARGPMPGGLAGGPPGGLPPGALPPGVVPGMKRGGRATFPVPMDSGSLGGKGRIEKAETYGAKAAKGGRSKGLKRPD
jgi:hypothetical protein